LTNRHCKQGKKVKKKNKKKETIKKKKKKKKKRFPKKTGKTEVFL